MCKTTFKRARQPEQIEQRRAAILAASALLLERDGIEQVSLNGIAREAKLAKSNIYRYFESREEIFLQLLKEDWAQWLEDIEKELESMAGGNDVEAVCALLVDSLMAAPRMCELISVLASVLENNLSEDALFKFKQESVQLGFRLLAAINKTLPTLTLEQALPIVHSVIALIAGLWPLGNPSPLVEKVMSRPELAPFKLEFKDALSSSLLLIFRGAYA